VLAAPFGETSGQAPEVHRVPGAPSLRRARRWIAALGSLVQRVAPYNDRLEWVAHAYSAGRDLLRRERISVVVSTSPPVATHIAAWLLQRTERCTWIADFRDPILGNPFRIRPHGIIYDKFVERGIVASADAVIVNTDAALDSFKARYPRHKHKFHLIWNGYDPEDDLDAAPIPARPYRVMAHLGSVYGPRHPGVLADSLRRIADRGRLDLSGIKLRLVGSLDRGDSWLRRPGWSSLVASGSVECTDGAVPRAAARKEMREADCLLLLDLNELGTGIQVPAKLFEYVRVGRPILAFTAKGSPVERILAQSGVPHICVYTTDGESRIDEKVLELLAMPNTPVHPSAWFRRQFDAVAQTEQLASIINAAAHGLGRLQTVGQRDATIENAS
jgi:glycosyltransferase involved in cell wall biosynthesis